jgi:hypothetical protein
MRTTTRLCLVASVVAAVGMSALPTTASAARQPGSVNLGQAAHHNDGKQNTKIKEAQRRANKAHKRINRLKDWNFTLQEWNSDQQSAIESVQNTVATIVAGVPTITSALTQLQAGLVALQGALEGPVTDAFEDIEDALNDPTTGLVGLNLARPQFGVFLGDGTFQGGTGPPNSPFGPSGNAFVVPGTDGTYVVDFGNDVSERVYSVTPFPTGAAPLAASVVNCAVGAGLSASIAGACDAAAGAAGPHPNLVFVLLQNTTNAAPTDGAFQVIAISG